ncbi:MAG: hypothetical protein AAF628_05720 [Planctomycetota bacterium]
MLDAFIVYFVGIFIGPNLPRGRVRRLFELAYWPIVRLGLWHRWSMYAPDVPDSTRIAVAGLRHADGFFEVLPVPGLEDGSRFGQARSLRFIAYQWALCDPQTEELRPAFCAFARRHAAAPSAPEAVAEVRVYEFPSPMPGDRGEELPAPEVRTVWTEAPGS